MKRILVIVTVALLLAVGASIVHAQSGYDLFQKALVKERAVGDVEEALRLYQRIVKEFGGNHALAAKAELRMGLLYDRLGRKADAQRAYQAVVNQYGDQTNEARQARAKIVVAAAPRRNINATPKTTTGPNVRQLWAGSDVDTEGAPSPDGRFLSFMEKTNNNLAVRDLITGQIRILTNEGKPNWDDGAYESIWSPDGKQIVYGWLTKENSDKYHSEALELRIINADGSGKRVLYRPDGPIYAWPFNWSPDGKYILVGFAQDSSESRTKEKLELVLMSVADGSVKPIKNFPNWDWRLSKRIFFSRDGNHIVYSVPVRDGSPARDVFLLSIDGKNDVPLIQSAADDFALASEPTTNKVLFASDRTGTTDIWSISVADGRPQGLPELIKRDVGPIEPLGLTANGSLYYSIVGGIREIYTAKLDPQTGKLIAQPTSLTARRTGSNVAGSWAPDGRRIAYRTTVWQGNPFTPLSKLVSAAIVIHDVETGAEREIVPQLTEYSGGAVWSPDGRSLAVYGKSRDGHQGVFRVDSQTGETAPLFLNEGVIGANDITWSPDGKAIYSWSFANRKYSVVVRNLESGEKKALYQSDDVITSIAVSPNGQHVSFRQQTKGKVPNSAAIMTMSITGGEPRELFRVQDQTLLGGVSETGGAVTWTPDGRYIFFTMRPDKNTDSYDLWRLPAEGGLPQKLGLKMDTITQLRVHPNGQEIMFTAGSRKPEVWVMENFLPPSQPRKTSVSQR